MVAAPSLPPRFEILRELGEGGQGVVWEVVDHERGGTVALKTMRRTTAASRRGLKDEFRAARDLVHENLVALHELFADGDVCFFTMEVVRGQDLVTHVRGDGAPVVPSFSVTRTIEGDDRADERTSPAGPTSPLSAAGERRLRAAFAGLARGIGVLHAAGKLHRDLKPSNVLVGEDGRVTVLDYGLVSDAGTRAAGFQGTPAYAAPEQGGGAITPAIDLYALGVMMFEALTGTPPFAGGNLQVLSDKVQRAAPDVATRAPGAPADLAALCDALLDRDPSRRPTADDVQRALGHERVGTRAPPPVELIGRSAELARLDAALAEGRRRSVVVAVEGRSGIGKSALVRAFTAAAVAGGATVLAGACSHREVVPFNAFDGVIDALARSAPRGMVVDPAAARVFPVLAGWASSPDDEVPPDVVRRRAFEAVRALLAERAKASPLAVVIDDYQWADRDSHALLSDLLRGAPELPVLVVLIRRDDDALPALPWAATRLEVGPLADDSARVLARSFAADADVDAIVGAAHGHPMLLLEVARGGAPQRGLDTALRERITREEPLARRVITLLAVSVAPLGVRELSDALEAPAAEVSRALIALRHGALARVAARSGTAAFEPAHDRVRESLLDGTSAEEMRVLHARLAQLVTDPHALVHHLAGAGEPERAARAARTAAKLAIDTLAFDRAALLLRDCLALAPHDPEETLVIRGELADALANAHHATVAAEELLIIAAARTGGERRAAQRRAAELLLASGNIERGTAILAEVLSVLDVPLPGGPLATTGALLIERVRLSRRGLALASPPARVDALALERADALRGAAQGFGMADNLRAALYQAKSLRASLDLGDPTRAATALAIEAIFRGSVDSASRPAARALLDRAEQLAEGVGSAEPACWVEGGRSVLEALELPGPHVVGRLERAENGFLARTTGTTWAQGSLRLIRALSLRILGDLPTLRAVLPTMVRDAQRRSDLYLETTLLRGGVELSLCDGDLPGARAALTESRWAPRDASMHVQHWLELEARALIDLHEDAPASVLALHLSAARRAMVSPVLRLQRIRVLLRALHARLALAYALATGGVIARREATWLAGKLDGEGVGYASARASLVRAAVAAMTHDEDGLLRELRRAVALADRHGLCLTGAAARVRLADVVGGDEGESLRRAADAWMTAAQVRDPARVVAMEAPGFTSSSRRP